MHYGFWALKITIILEPEKRGDGRWFKFWFYHYGDWSLTGYIVSGIETLYESLAGTFRIKGRNWIDLLCFFVFCVFCEHLCKGRLMP